MVDADNFFNKIITGDETWCFAYDPEAKRQSSDWVGETSPRLKKPKFRRLRIKIVLIIFFDSKGIAHKEFVPEGKTVNAEFYKGVMDRPLKRIHRVRPAPFCSRFFSFLHDIAPAHKAASVCQFLTPKIVTTLYYPPYSPTLSPPDYFLFPKLKINLKGPQAADVAEIQEAVTDELKKVQKIGIFGSFSETVRPRKSLHICQRSLF